MKVLFICSRNRLRSPTAETIFSDYQALEVASAGTAPDAENRLDSELVDWADIIFVMERVHRSHLFQKFKPWLRNKRVICLNIPDNYDYMDSRLVDLLTKKVLPLLGTSG